MANTGFKGCDVRQTGNQLVFRAFFQTSGGAKETAGPVTAALYELQSDGTLKSYDFNDNTFKTTALTTATASATHQKGNNNTVNTGVWTYALATLTGFTVGSVYLVQMNDGGASPTDQTREFQYGGYQGDLLVTAGATGQAYLQTDVTRWIAGAIPAVNVTGVPLADVKYALGTIVTTATAGVLDVNTKNYANVAAAVDANNLPKVDVEDWHGSAVLAPDTAGAPKLSSYDSLLIANGTGTATGGGNTSITLQTAIGADTRPVGCVIKVISGTGAGQARSITAYTDASKVVNVDRAWATNPNATSVYAIYAANAPALNSSLYVTSASVQGLVTGNILGSVIGSVGSVLAAVTVGGYASNQDPGTYVLVTPANKLATNGSGYVNLAANDSQIRESGTAQAGAANSITLAAGASNNMTGCWVRTTGGTGPNQQRPITAFNNGTKLASVDPNWDVTPDATTTYAVLYSNQVILTGAQHTSIGNDVWNTLRSSHTTAGTFGEYVSANVTQWGGSAAGALPANFGALVISVAGFVTLSAAGTDQVLVAGKKLTDALRFIGATAAGTLPSGAGTGQENWKDFAGAAAVDVTVDGSGNRTTIVYH